jgi:hypothetical protein
LSRTTCTAFSLCANEILIQPSASGTPIPLTGGTSNSYAVLSRTVAAPYWVTISYDPTAQAYEATTNIAFPGNIVNSFSGDSAIFCNSASTGNVTASPCTNTSAYQFYGNPTASTGGAGFYSIPAAALPGAIPISKVGSAGLSASGQVGIASTGAISFTQTAHNIATPLACADSSGSGTVQACTTSPTFTPAAGDCVNYTTTTANSGTGLTINVNSSTAYSAAKWAGSTTTLAAGDIPANKQQRACLDAANHWEIDTIGNAPTGGSSSGGTNTYTSSQSASTSDNGMLVVMNCSAPCAYTLPNPQPSSTFATKVKSVGTTVATIALGSTMTYNGASNVPVLLTYAQIDVTANSQTSTDYKGSIPIVASTGISIATNSYQESISATGAGSGPCQAHYFPASFPLSDSITATSWSTSELFATTISIPTTCIGAGSMIIIRAHGTYTNNTTASPVIAFAVSAGGNSAICPGTSHSTSPSLSQTASVWDLECKIQINTTGTPGTAVAWGNVEWSNSTGTSGATVIVPFNNNSTGTVSFTTSTAETVSIQETATPVSGQIYNLTGLDGQVTQ